MADSSAPVSRSMPLAQSTSGMPAGICGLPSLQHGAQRLRRRHGDSTQSASVKAPPMSVVAAMPSSQRDAGQVARVRRRD